MNEHLARVQIEVRNKRGISIFDEQKPKCPGCSPPCNCNNGMVTLIGGGQVPCFRCSKPIGSM